MYRQMGVEDDIRAAGMPARLIGKILLGRKALKARK